MQLERNDFLQIIRNAPLVSIDLIVRDERDRVLVGVRVNRPAQGSWFVPGGRVYKDERLDIAFDRITRAELGTAMPRSSAKLRGVYEHLYEDNALDVPGVSTHYIVLGHELRVQSESLVLPDQQHSRYRWMAIEELLSDPTVHANTRAYFDGTWGGV